MTVEKEKQAGWKQKIIHEMNEYWLNFVFLAVVFSVMTLYRRLLMAEYHIAYLHYGFAVIQAAVLAKVILLAEVARVGRKYEEKPLILPTLYKTITFALRAWTDQFNDWFTIRSELAVAVYDAVQGAGMSFPFPQREVRLIRDEKR
jgi:hypothetical protein